MACATCWRTLAGPAGLIHLGLIYTDVDVVMRHHETPPGSFRDIQTLEAAALEALAEIRP